MTMQDYERAIMAEEKAQAERQHALWTAVQRNFETVMHYGTDEDLLELQRALKPLALRIIERQPG